MTLVTHVVPEALLAWRTCRAGAAFRERRQQRLGELAERRAGLRDEVLRHALLHDAAARGAGLRAMALERRADRLCIGALLGLVLRGGKAVAGSAVDLVLERNLRAAHLLDQAVDRRERI